MHFVDAKGIFTGSGGHYGMNIYREEADSWNISESQRKI